MLFNSLAFLVFFPIITIVYWILPSKYRNLFLLFASYYFYMSWNMTYGLLILFSSFITWISAKLLYRSIKNKSNTTIKIKPQFIIGICLTLNLLVLFVFKYANWGIETIDQVAQYFSWGMNIPKMDILLPVGISFYTFQAIGYTLDVYKKKLKPEKSFFIYTLFVSFFPQLVAGPIERAASLLPQFHRKNIFNIANFNKGMQLMLWGYFLKLCIADRVSPYVDAVFNNLPQHNGSSMLLASFFFTFQIYGDFCGYSLIAIGVAKTLNFKLMDNFRQPYLSASIKDFWRRWHISLSTWFMDYVFIPLGGSRCSMGRHLFNLLLTFVVSGLWHGANWTFLSWGAYHGVIIVAYVVFARYDFLKYVGRLKFVNILFTFCLVLIGWIFFRANSISDAFVVINQIFTNYGALYKGVGVPNLLLGFCCIMLVIINDTCQVYFPRIKLLSSDNPLISGASMGFMIAFILLFAEFNGGQFIYFQF